MPELCSTRSTFAGAHQVFLTQHAFVRLQVATKSYEDIHIIMVVPDDCFFRLPFQIIALVTATAQISSLVFCLAWSIKFNFYESTATHCHVDNYLPSLSATLDFTPQRDVWRACIGLSSMPRYFIAYLYCRLIYNSKVLLYLHWTEVSALIGLSIVDSIKYFCKLQFTTNQNSSESTPTNRHHSTAFHATCVGIFLLTSIIHMTLVCTDLVRSNVKGLTLYTRQKLLETQIVKKRIAILNFIAIILALYLYDRHNRLCEPGVYSMFSFLEYIVIVANVVYHLQAYYDLSEYSIAVERYEPEMSRSLIGKVNNSAFRKNTKLVD